MFVTASNLFWIANFFNSGWKTGTSENWAKHACSWRASLVPCLRVRWKTLDHVTTCHIQMQDLQETDLDGLYMWVLWISVFSNFFVSLWQWYPFNQTYWCALGEFGREIWPRTRTAPRYCETHSGRRTETSGFKETTGTEQRGWIAADVIQCGKKRKECAFYMVLASLIFETMSFITSKLK